VDERPYIQLPAADRRGAVVALERNSRADGLYERTGEFTRANLHPCPAVGACKRSHPAILSNAPLDPMANVNGWRLDAMPHFGLDFSGPGYFLRPNLGWELTQYALRDNDIENGESSPQRNPADLQHR